MKYSATFIDQDDRHEKHTLEFNNHEEIEQYMEENQQLILESIEEI